jgi:hypothetical protein
MKTAVSKRPPRTTIAKNGTRLSSPPSSDPHHCCYTEAQLCDCRERVATARLDQNPSTGYSRLFRRARVGGLPVTYERRAGAALQQCEGHASAITKKSPTAAVTAAGGSCLFVAKRLDGVINTTPSGAVLAASNGVRNAPR